VAFEDCLKRNAAHRVISIEPIARNVTDQGKGMLHLPKSFVSRIRTLGGYEVRGWRYAEEAAWHLKVKSTRDYRCENAYVVTDGEFDSKTGTIEERMLILGLIAEWEAELLKTATDLG
jgi:hypothetical protein